ncbi:MAG: YraN family protein [Thiomargarita sp.]|nr:YraN family protein [Thiomargarita sp.]
MSIQSEYGKWAEKLAHDYLCKQGLHFVTQNYRCQMGEIDLIMLEQNILVFIEVRYRKNKRYGGSLESISLRKQQHILDTATRYIQAHQWAQQHSCRFDVVLIEGFMNKPELRWISNAFDA